MLTASLAGVQAFRKVANGPLWFGLPVTSISNSQVVLNVNAASLQLVVNASPGKIMFGQVSSSLPSEKNRKLYPVRRFNYAVRHG